MKSNNHNIVKYISLITEILNAIQNTIINEFNNPFSINIFIPLFDKIFDYLNYIFNFRFMFMFKNNSSYVNNIQFIRILTNKILYMIHYVLLVQYVNNNGGDDFDLDLNFFDDKFFSKDDINEYFFYKDLNHDSFISKLTNYHLLDFNFKKNTLILKIDDINDEINLCVVLKFILYMISYTIAQINKFLHLYKFHSFENDCNLNINIIDNDEHKNVNIIDNDEHKNVNIIDNDEHKNVKCYDKKHKFKKNIIIFLMKLISFIKKKLIKKQ